MAILKVVKHPNEFLRKISRAVEVFDEKLALLILDMKETLEQQDGVGLAAVQVGILKRVCIVKDVENEDEEIVLINPVIIKKSKNKIHREGCLSVPDTVGEVKRPNKLTVEFFDENGNKKARDFEGFICQIIGHEMDHMDGILFTDKLYVREEVEEEK